MNFNPTIMAVSLLAACLLVPVLMLAAADWVVSRASMPEDKRYHAELWRLCLYCALPNLALLYGLMAFAVSIMVSTFNMLQSQLLLDLPAIVWFILCYRKMANLRASLVPDTEFRQYAPKCTALKFRVYASVLLLMPFVMAVSAVMIGSNDDFTFSVLVSFGLSLAYIILMYIFVVRYIPPLYDRILPASEMEMLKSKLAEANRLLNQHLPDGHIPVKLEIMRMMHFKDSFQSVSVDMVSEKRVSVTFLGLKQLDEKELLFLSLSEAFTGLSNKSQIAADQRALAITDDCHTAISALKKELDTAFGLPVRYLQKRIKALEVI